MWLLLVASALAGPAYDLVGAWRLDTARSDSTESAFAAFAPVGPPGGGMGGGPPPGGMGGSGMGGGPPGGGMGGGMGGGPPGGGMGGGMGGGPPGDSAEGAPAGGAPTGAMMLGGLLLGGALGLQVGEADDGMTIAWGPTPPLTLVVDGPAVKVSTPVGVVRVRARLTSFGVAVERRVSGATLTETLFRDGDALVVAIEAEAPGKEVVFLRRVYDPTPAGSRSNSPGGAGY